MHKIALDGNEELPYNICMCTEKRYIYGRNIKI